MKMNMNKSLCVFKNSKLFAVRAVVAAVVFASVSFMTGSAFALCDWPEGSLTNQQVIAACNCHIANLSDMMSVYHCMSFSSNCSGGGCSPSNCYCEECVSGWVLQPGSLYCAAPSSYDCVNNGSATCSSGKCIQPQKSMPVGFSCMTLYYCDSGYYGTATAGTNNCTRCPSLEGVYGSSNSYPIGSNTTIQSCYLTCSSITGSDGTGNWKYSGGGNYQ